VLTLGAGGLWVELLRDVVHRILPVDPAEIRSMVTELGIYDVLRAMRGGKRGDLDGVIAAAGAVADCISCWGEISEIEINPLFVYEDRVAPVDARVVLAPPAGAP
jgi:hypothetical protein